MLRRFQGATKHLPHITAWQSTFVEEGEELCIWQSDMQNAFFKSRIPPQWHSFLSFNIVRRRCDVMISEDTDLVALACNVLPMGWGSSVAIMQEISEGLLSIPTMRPRHKLDGENRCLCGCFVFGGSPQGRKVLVACLRGQFCCRASR